MKVTSVKMEYLIRDKKVREKWLNFLQVTKFFPDEIFPRLSFSQPIFFPDFFLPDKEFILIFFQLFFFSYLFAKFIIAMFFWCALFIVIEQSSFNKNFEMRVKARNWKK